MTAERRRAAQLDGAHDARFDAAERALPVTAIGRAVAAEDIRHFQNGARTRRSGGRRDGQVEAVQRALRHGDRRGRHMGVARRRRQIAVAQQDLDDPGVGSALQKMGGEACGPDPATKGAHRLGFGHRELLVGWVAQHPNPPSRSFPSQTPQISRVSGFVQSMISSLNDIGMPSFGNNIPQMDGEETTICRGKGGQGAEGSAVETLAKAGETPNLL
jgi:hypothetical protein